MRSDEPIKQGKWKARGTRATAPCEAQPQTNKSPESL